MKTRLLTGWTLLWAVAACAGPAEEKAARTAAIQRELATINAQLAAHGGTFEKWAGELKPFREDLPFLGKVPARDGLQFQGQSARVIQCDDLDALPEGCRPFEAIAHFDRQLKARGIDLILAIIPSKICVYPDYLNVATNQPARCPADRQVALGVKRLNQKLLEADIEVIDLYTAYQEARAKTQDKVPLVYQRDAHWKNAGCRVAADEIGARLQRYDFVKTALTPRNRYLFKPGSRADGIKADPDLHLVEDRDGKPYADVGDSPVVVTGDSYATYNRRSDGPTGHISAQVGLRIGLPVTLLSHEGLSYQMPLALGELPGHLKGRRVIVWTFNDRMLPLTAGKNAWAKVDLTEQAAALTTTAAAPVAAARSVTVTLGEVSAPPSKEAPYAHYYLLAYSKDQDAVLHILAMHNRKILPTAALQPGDKIQVRLSPWSAVAKTHGRIQSGTLPTVQLQINKPHYLAEIPGAPLLTEVDLKRAGEE